MKLVKPSVKMLDTSKVLELIELVGRTCYKSEDNIKPGSAEQFVRMIIKRGHHAMIEFSNFIFEVNPPVYSALMTMPERQFIRLSCEKRGLVSGSARAFRELFQQYQTTVPAIFIKFLKNLYPILFEDIEIDMKIRQTLLSAPVSVQLVDASSLMDYEYLLHNCLGYKVICDRGVTHEIVRHRLFSYAQESTRYCNYKGGVTFITPLWLYASKGYSITWKQHMKNSEKAYIELLNNGWTPQQARSVLPNSLKTEINIYGNMQEWSHFLKLRTSPKAHPQMQEIANMIKEDLIEKEIIN